MAARMMVPGAAAAKTKYDADQAAYQTKMRDDAVANNAASEVRRAASDGAGYSTSYTNPTTGVHTAYNPGGGGGARGAGGGSGSPYDIWSAYAKSRGAVARPQQARIKPMTAADRSGAEGAAFGRAKDRIGQATQGLMKSVNSSYSRRGLAGSGLEADAMSGALDQGAGQTGEVIRDQAIEGLRRQSQVDDANYAGNIQQRGQDISQRQQYEDMIMALTRMSQQGAY
jgi:hypothetical protein